MGIKLRFERPFVRDNTNRIVANESDIVQQANLIATKVSQTDFNGNTISSLINQTATTIKIQAQKIQLEGLVTANNNFKVLLDGSIEAVNGKFSGNITGSNINIGGKFLVDTSGNLVATSASITGNINGSNISGGTINIGSRFSVDANGNLVASNATLSGSITATKMIAPNGADYYGEIGVSAGYVGFGLYDLRYNTEAFFEVLSTVNGSGFSLRDRNNYTRFQAGVDYTVIRDANNVARFQAGQNDIVIRDANNVARFSTASDRTSMRGPSGYEGILLGATNGYLQSPNNNTYFYVSNSEAGVVVNGVVKVRWN